MTPETQALLNELLQTHSKQISVLTRRLDTLEAKARAYDEAARVVAEGTDLVAPAETREDVKLALSEYVSEVWSHDTEPTPMRAFTIKFNKRTKPYGGVGKLLAELCAEGTLDYVLGRYHMRIYFPKSVLESLSVEDRLRYSRPDLAPEAIRTTAQALTNVSDDDAAFAAYRAKLTAEGNGL